jgi:hypothetical protein
MTLVVVMMPVNLWKAQQAGSFWRLSEFVFPRPFVQTAEKAPRSMVVACPRQFLRNYSTIHPQVFRHFFTAENQHKKQFAAPLEKGTAKIQNYWSASIKRVMVRLRSLSERRISSILLME